MTNIKQKILLLLLSGVALGYSPTPSQQRKVFKELCSEWKKIDKKELKKQIQELYRSKMIKYKENADESTTITLTEKGKLRILTYNFSNIKIKNQKWDGKWRIVIFDIPEKKRGKRDALREKIKKIGFYELQKSVWVYPLDCKDEIDFIIEFFGLRKYVRFIIADFIDSEIHLKKIFRLT